MALLSGTIETPRDLYLHKLGAALKMENTILDMLPQLEENAIDSELKEALRMHHQQTQQHVANLEQAFQVLGEEVDESTCPAIEGLQKEGQATLKLVDDRLNDQVIIAGVAETEHHEIAVYDGLIHNAQAMGEQKVASLLEKNLRDEEGALERARTLGRQLAADEAATRAA